MVMIGVDIGTTSTKAVLFNKEGEVLYRANVEYPLYTPTPATAEQDPDEIFQAVVTVIKQCSTEAKKTKNEVEFVSFSSAMHSLIVVDQFGKPVTNSITWADNRSSAYVEKVKHDYNGHMIYLRTGTPLHPMSPFVKLVWMREEHPEWLKKENKFISIKEYVFYRLFGQFVIDYSIASATGMFHLENLDWDEEVLQIIGISREQLSVPVSTTTNLTGLIGEFANEMGLHCDTPFFVGASDGVLSNLGVNAIDRCCCLNDWH